MARKSNQSHWNIEDLTDAEISAAIHYLDLDSRGKRGADTGTRAICLTVIFLFLEYAVFILLYYHVVA
jgi:hypothetical protein